MQSFGRFSVFPVIPDGIGRLPSFAYNLWWAWHPEAQQLFRDIDPTLWEEVNHNPVKFLSRVHSEPLERAAGDPDYCARYNRVMVEFDAYMAADNTWFKQTYPDQRDAVIAYFSPEFGLHESLPIYSGGLGILAGDHCKEASDLGLPFVGVGFLYPQGYFIQRINADGVQEAINEKMRFSEVPARPATGPDGREVVIHVDLPGRKVYAKVWTIQVGRIPLYLMDTDVDPNQPGDRDLGARLYIGDSAMRVAQEIVLGIGGVRALRALGINPTVWHMNEGHSAFLGLERIRELVQKEGLAFEEAQQVVKADTVFTTHTPVPAGNEAFAFDLIDQFFGPYWPQLGVSRDEFLNFARLDQPWGPTLSMTILALKLSQLANGVSELHGDVSRDMWHFLWPELPASEVPITSITNGVHTDTWLNPAIGQLFDEYLGHDWRDHLDEPALWARVDAIPDERLWEVHSQLKRELVDFTRERVRAHRARLGEGPAALAEAERLLDPDALTIGFARRFATYKRATLFMQDMQRLHRILHDPDRPVQFIFAGKAHPADEPGKAFIRQIYHLSRTPEFAGKIVFIEDYDMKVARFMNSGTDVWLNNPQRPREASGTSGQKASLNGLPNWSILDGWWVEGYDGENGWAIGEGKTYSNEETQNESDAVSLYETLEYKLIPAYYDRENGVPPEWTRRMKAAIKTLAWRFSMRRMVKEYTTRLYLPAAAWGAKFRQHDYKRAKDLAAWVDRLGMAWSRVSISVDAPREGQLAVGSTVPVTARVHLGSIKPEDMRVEVVSWRTNEKGQPRDLAAEPLTLDGHSADEFTYKGEIVARASGNLSYGVRVRPAHPDLAETQALRYVKWA